MYWSHSLDDLKTLVSLKTQDRMAGFHQDYETFRLVVDEALGGGGDSTPNEDEAIQSFDQLAKAFADMGGSLG